MRHLEIPVEATIRMEASIKSVEPIERFTQIDEQHYKPLTGQLRIACTKEVLPVVETETLCNSDEED